MFNFRRLSPDDFPLMLAWLQKSHVRQWWNDGDDTLGKVAAHYGASDETARFILQDGEKPIGYFQYYFADDGGAIGIDQFIGDETYLNRGVGTEAVKMFIRMIIAEHRPSFIFLDPSPENARAIRCYENVGFRHYQTEKLDDGSSAYIMRLEISAIESVNE
jgi:RimJ/RimL family protein N-acetyltransferase